MSEDREVVTFEDTISDYTFGANKNAPDNKNIPVAKLENSVPKSSDKKDVPPTSK